MVAVRLPSLTVSTPAELLPVYDLAPAPAVMSTRSMASPIASAPAMVTV